MIVNLFHTYLSTPIYNLLVFLIGIVPGGDAGMAVILVTLAVRILLLPLTLSAVRTQRVMRVIEPELAALKKKHTGSQELQAKGMLELYRKYKINPFASFFTMLIQLPVLLALYWVFRGEALPTIDTSVLYSFIVVPATVSSYFLGIFLVTGKSIVLGVFAGITQFLQAHFAIPVPKKPEDGKGSMSQDFGRAMAMQAKYVLPLVIALVAYETSGAVALYFITTNLVTVAQEFLVRKSPISTNE